MLDYIAGKIAEVTPASCVIDCHGVGYEAAITLIDYTKLQNAESAKLYVHESIREDAHLLFGFVDKESRSLFRMLISVNSVGPAMARLILSSLTTAQLQEVIATENLSALKGVKGVGTKTAQRIIVDLKDKINSLPSALSVSTSPLNEAYNDALSALVMLGFSKAQSEKVLRKVFEKSSSVTTEEAIRIALSMM